MRGTRPSFDEVKTSAPGFVDRRRPGRMENVNPELIPLLRGQAVVSPPLQPISNRKLYRSELMLWVAVVFFVGFVAFLALGGVRWAMAPATAAAEPIQPTVHVAKSPPDLRMR
jgi:hypothetical protein